jgi:hypothetical protein
MRVGRQRRYDSNAPHPPVAKAKQAWPYPGVTPPIEGDLSACRSRAGTAPATINFAALQAN